MNDTIEYVVFKVKDELYGIDIKHVSVIEKIKSITRVPYTKNYIEGVVNLRGNIIPVIDLRKRFNMTRDEFNDDSRIIITNYNELTIGLIADSSSEVIQIEKTSIESAPNVKNESERDRLIREVGKSDGKIIMLIDLKKLFEYKTETNIK